MSFMVNQLTGFGAGSAESSTKVLTFLGSIAWSSGSTISGSIDIGAVHSQKEIFLVCQTAGAASRTLTAASTTVDGVAVTKATGEHQQQSLYTNSCAFAATPTQSGSVTITATFNNTLTSGIVAVYSCLNRTNIGANQTDAAQASSAGAATLSIVNTTINVDGIWLGCHQHQNTNATTSPSGVTVDYDVSTTYRKSFEHRDFQGSSSTPTDVWSWTGSVVCGASSWAFD